MTHAAPMPRVRPAVPARTALAVLAAVACCLLLLPAFAAVALMWLFSATVRAIGRLIEPQYVPWRELITFDPELGWKPRPNLDAHYLADADDVYRLVTDDEGWPGRRTIEESDVVVIGDSFAFGYGVDTGRSFAHLRPGVAIKALGSPGYSMVHSVLVMEQNAHRLRGKLVVWFICLENDLEDNLSPSLFSYRSPFLRQRPGGGWEIYRDHVSEARWHCSEWGARLISKLCVPGPIGDRIFSGAEHLVRRAAETCRQAGARLVMVTIPQPAQLTADGRAALAAASGNGAAFDASLPDRRLAKSCARYGVRFVAGMDHLTIRDYKRLEGIHWNGRGHRRVADLLHELYASHRTGTLDEPQRVPRATAADSAPTLEGTAVGSR